VSSSRDGVDILKILALSVRPEQDYEVLKSGNSEVGWLLNRASSSEIQSVLTAGQSPPVVVPGATRLVLREALNKIAHMDPSPGRSSYAVGGRQHEVILTGKRNDHVWIAILDIPALCNAIKALPDRTITSGAT
jgi:hypothetical protein